MFKQLVTYKLLLLFGVCGMAQTTQNIKGKIVDAESRFPLLGANVVLLSDTSKFTGTTADENGYFKLENIALGRHTLKFSFIGYNLQVLPNITVTSGKEVFLEILLHPSSVNMQEVEITATQNKGDAINEMALVSSRVFSVEETDRYAGSRGDPARMASNYAGVLGVDDSRNDIVVRGNSPLGVLWKLENVNIPNPNHFSIAGSSGGPVSILNNKVLSNSDFYTGAFPAEFGNSTAGVFDVRMRNGNKDKVEFTGQFGFLGTELTTEGQISKNNNSSFLFNYRYSTLALFGFLGVRIGTSAVPKYQDAAIKLNFPTKKNGNWSIFGVGGISDIDIVISEQKPDEIELYGENDRDQYFGTAMGVAGISYTKSFNRNTYSKITLAHSYEQQKTLHQFIYRRQDSTGNVVLTPQGEYINDSLSDILRYKFKTNKTGIYAFINRKIGSSHVIKFGIDAELYQFNFQDSVNTSNGWMVRWNYDGTASLLQPHIQWKWRPSEKVTATVGLHSQYFSLNNSFSPLEPRAAIQYNINNTQWLNAAFGMHSQLQPTYTYFYHLTDKMGNKILHNINMGFTKSIHYVVGYGKTIGKNIRIKSELYYQSLYNIPVTLKPSSFSLVNQGSGFTRFFPDSLQNTGTGHNYGVEFTLEKFFSKGYFFMITTSLFESKYTGSDGIERDTDYNGNYVVNLLGTKEFKVRKKNMFSIGTNITTAGNKRFGPVDTTATKAQSEIIYVDSLRNTKQFDDYFRVDLQLKYRINAKKVSHEIGLDIVNLLDTKNVLKLSYAPDITNASSNPIREEYQLGRLPLFYYKIDF